MKEIHLRRGPTYLAFFAVVVAAVLMGVYLKQAINNNSKALREIQASRIESCQRTYNIFNDLIDQSVRDQEKDHKLTKKEKNRIKKYKRLLDPRKCTALTVVPSTTTTG